MTRASWFRFSEITLIYVCILIICYLLFFVVVVVFVDVVSVIIVVVVILVIIMIKKATPFIPGQTSYQQCPLPIAHSL